MSTGKKKYRVHFGHIHLGFNVIRNLIQTFNQMIMYVIELLNPIHMCPIFTYYQ